MSLRTHVVFRAKYPDPPIFSDTDDLFRGPGVKTAFILIGALKRAGFDVSHLCERDYYGWVFTVAEKIQFIIQCGLEETPESEESLLLSSYLGVWLFGKSKAEALQQKILQIVSETLKNDTRFAGMRWFTEEEFSKKDSGPGHPNP